MVYPLKMVIFQFAMLVITRPGMFHLYVHSIAKLRPFRDAFPPLQVGGDQFPRLPRNKRAEENVDGGKGSVLITINGKTTRHRRAIKTFINKCMYEDHVNVI